MFHAAVCNPAFHGQMLATWHSLGDGLYYPALAGSLDPEMLVYLVPQDGQLVGFSTWEEARNVAAAAQQVQGHPLYRVEMEPVALHARRSTPAGQRSRVNACCLAEKVEVA